MNLTSLVAIFAMQWRRGRPALYTVAIGAFLVFVGMKLRNAPLATRFMLDRDDFTWTVVADSSVDLMATILLISISVFITMMTNLFIHSDAEKLCVSLPTRVMRLPLSTAKLVAVFAFYNAVTIGATAAIVTGALKSVIHTDFGWWVPIALSVSLMGGLQAWAFGFGNTNPRSGLIVLCLMAFGGVWVMRQESMFSLLGSDAPGPLIIAATVWLALTYFLSVWGVRMNRQGGFPDPSLRRDTRPGAANVRLKPFASAARAQYWYEWRLHGWQLPVSVLGILLAYFIGMPLVVAIFRVSDVTGISSSGGFESLLAVNWVASPHFITTGLQLSAVMAGVLVGGILFMRAGVWNKQSTYLLSRPLSTRSIANARIVVMFCSAMTAIAVLAGAMGLITGLLLLMGETPVLTAFLHQGYEHVPAIGVLLFFWGSLFFALWIGVWSVNLGWALAFFAMGVAPAYFAQGLFLDEGTVAGSTEAYTQVFRMGARVATPLLILSTLWVIVRAYQMKVVRGGFVLLAGVCWLTYGMIFVYYGTTLNRDKPGYLPYEEWAIPFPHPIDWVIWAGLSVLPIAPLFSHAYFLERARRR